MSAKRLTSLDTLRGIAALSVVFWHWQHFFALSGAWQTGWRRDMQPFYWAFKPLYLQGWAAVDLFFVLSGFVFFWLYSEKIATRGIGAGRFWLLRFSRLYPLHFALLIVAAVLQAFYFREVHTFFIYQGNDVGHFVANVFMVQAWWPHVPQTFDGPAWSVSIEVLLYVVFFAACRAGLRAGWPSLATAALGIPLLWFDEHIARGVMGFFMGGTAFAAWRSLRSHSAAVTATRSLGVLVAALWILLAVMLWRDSSLLMGGETNATFLLAFDLILCPLTVLALAMHEATGGRTYARAAFLGDISYATYLLHFPLQLGLVLIAVRCGVSPAFFMHGWVLIAFFATLIGLGAAVYYGFERPMQNWLRGRKPAHAVVVID